MSSPPDTFLDIVADVMQPTTHCDPQLDPATIPLPIDLESLEPFGSPCDISAREHSLFRELEETKAALAALHSEHDCTKELLRVRSEELRGAQAFIVTADKMAVSDVQRAVQRLNAENFQLATSIAEKWTYRSEYEAKGDKRKGQERKGIERMKGVIGRRLVGVLRSIRHDESPYCVQIALQSCLAVYSARMCEHWTSNCDGGEDLLRTTYARLKSSGKQSVMQKLCK